ncbi:MAG: hypothetical protein ICCCNLDF_01960 [Planctomycetes bacterium]|nr:hypothetical protein [Planctomycetota bacterium]
MRRELAVIIGITALVVALVLLLGPQLTRVETGSPKPADSIPLPPLKSERPTPEPDQPQDLQPLRVEVLDAVTGRQIERDTAIDLTHLDGTWLDQMRGRFDGEPIGFTEPPIGRPLLLRLRLPGYVDAAAGPIVLAPGVPMVTRVKLLPLYRIDIVPRLPEGDKLYAVRVFSVTPPTWPETRPYSEWRAPVGGSAGFMLPPGRYWCQLPRHNPTVHTDYEDRGNWTTTDWLSKTPGYPITWPNFLFEFEVKDAPLTLAPEVAWPKGELMISGRLVNAKQQPQPRRRVLAIRMGPGCMREVAGSARTDEDGRFLLNGLLPGDYRIAEQEGEYNDGEEAVWLGRLKEGEPPPEVLLVTGRVQKAVDEPKTGSIAIRMLRNGEPIAGAKLEYRAPKAPRGWWQSVRNEDGSDGRSDAAGWIHLLNVPAGEYLLRGKAPRSLYSMDVTVEAGNRNSCDYELAPKGSASLSGYLRFEGGTYPICTLQGATETDSVSLEVAEDGLVSAIGIAPGTWQLRAYDRVGFKHEYPLEFTADTTLAFEREERFARLTGQPPYPGFWDLLASIDYVDAFGLQDERWHRKLRGSPDWTESISIDHLPRRKFMLVARSGYGKRAVALADVDTTAGDVAEINWTLLGTPEGASGGTLEVESLRSVDQPSAGYVNLFLAESAFGPVLVVRKPIEIRYEKLLVSIGNLVPGSWNVALEADGFETLKTAITIKANHRTVVQLRPAASARNDAHDRPTGGINIKLPPPASTGPPPEPLPAPPREVVPPPLPPRPLANDEPLAGREVWLYPTGAEVAELWHALIHVRYGRHSRPIAVAESDWHLRASLVYAHGRPAILLQGLDEDDTGLTLRLPGREPVRVALVAGRSAYSVDVP